MRSPRLRRSIAAFTGLVAASLMLSGCLYSVLESGEGKRAQPRTSNTPSSVAAPAGLESFYTQKLTWKDCGPQGFDCTDVTVPLDYKNPDKRSITIAVIRHSAGKNAKGSLLINPGGPGSSGVSMVRDNLDFAVRKELSASYDVIGFDPRGVGASTAVRCYDAADMDKYLFDPYTSPRGSDARDKESAARERGFAEACAKNSDGILPYITTEFSARDMDVIRAVLGDDKLNYLGYSYGTRLGAMYAGLFPERTGRLVLDGAIDPAIPDVEVGLTQARGFEAALRAYMDECLKGKDCPFSGTVDSALADLRTLMKSVDAKPLVNSDGRKLTGDTLNMAISAALYSKDNWSILSQALQGALDGDPAMSFLLADFYYGRDQNGQYESNQQEAFAAYNCMDYADKPLSKAEEDKQLADLKKAAPTIAEFWGSGDTCADWVSKPTARASKIITADGAAPIVVIGTTNDPATPYAWAQGLSKELASGVLVTRVGEGHTGYNKGNTCVDTAIDDFFVQGTVPKDGLRCER